MIAGLLSSLGPWNWWILVSCCWPQSWQHPCLSHLDRSGGTGNRCRLASAVGTRALELAGQLILFAILSVIVTLIGRRYYGSDDARSDEPLLNRRGESLVGRTATLWNRSARAVGVSVSMIPGGLSAGRTCPQACVFA